MPQNVKELIVVLGLTLPLWALLRRFFEPLAPAGAFALRRNTWLCLTVFGLLSPNIWIYALLAGPVIYRAARRDANPAALCVLLFFAVPNAAVDVPAVFVNELFAISHQRLLALALILPLALAVRSRPAGFQSRSADAMDLALIAFMLLGLAVNVPLDSATHTLRRLFLFVLDTGLLFFLFSRLRPDMQTLRDVMAAWVLAGLLLSAVAVFESLRGWLLYAPIAERWGDANRFAFLLRTGTLRAQAAAGHSLTLGIWLVTAWAFFLFVQRGWARPWARTFVALLLLGGLWATLARGAWLAALLSTAVYLALDPRGSTKGLQALLGLGGALLVLMVSPLGSAVIDYLPFVGTVDAGNVEYRQRLFDTSLALIQARPWFGNPLALSDLESLRQGQGIIDLVNGYVRIALFYGLAGLGLFAALVLPGVHHSLRVWRWFKQRDPARAAQGAGLVAAMLGTLFFIATAGVDPMTYMLAGMLGSYGWVWHSSRQEAARKAAQPQFAAASGGGA